MRLEKGKLADAMPLIMAHHYSRRRTADPMHVFLWKDAAGATLACAVFTSPVNRFFGKGAVELSRLVRKPECDGPMSRFVSQCLRWLKANTDLAFCLSYADEAAGHKGYVYQAGNFTYVRKSKSGTMWRHRDTGQVVSGRSMDQSARARKEEYERIPPSEKHLYVFPLGCKRRALLARFGWEPLPYPKHAGMDLC